MISLEAIPRVIYSLFFIFAGITHFSNPSIYDALVPSYLPEPRLMHSLAGISEIVLGLSLLTKWKSQGALFLAIFLVIVYLGNLHMWLNNIPFLGSKLSTNGHILRLIVQVVMILYSLNIWKTFR